MLCKLTCHTANGCQMPSKDTEASRQNKLGHGRHSAFLTMKEWKYYVTNNPRPTWFIHISRKLNVRKLLNHKITTFSWFKPSLRPPCWLECSSSHINRPTALELFLCFPISSPPVSLICFFCFNLTCSLSGHKVCLPMRLDWQAQEGPYHQEDPDCNVPVMSASHSTAIEKEMTPSAAILVEFPLWHSWDVFNILVLAPPGMGHCPLLDIPRHNA